MESRKEVSCEKTKNGAASLLPVQLEKKVRMTTLNEVVTWYSPVVRQSVHGWHGGAGRSLKGPRTTPAEGHRTAYPYRSANRPARLAASGVQFWRVSTMTAEDLLADSAMSVEDSAAFVGCGRTFLYAEMDAGRLAFCKLGRACHSPARTGPAGPPAGCAAAGRTVRRLRYHNAD